MTQYSIREYNIFEYRTSVNVDFKVFNHPFARRKGKQLPETSHSDKCQRIFTMPLHWLLQKSMLPADQAKRLGVMP
jgi:hypothetical protein